MKMSEKPVSEKKPSLTEIILDKALIIVLVVMIAIIVIKEPSFVQWRVIKDILTQSSIKLIVAIGLFFTLLIGGTDLSGGRQVGLAAVIVASMSQTATYSGRFFPNLPEIPIVIPILIAITSVAIIGLVNGWMVAKLKMAPFIATFGMMTIVYGINNLYITQDPNKGQPIGGISERLTCLSSTKIFGEISLLVVIALLVTIIAWFILNKTLFGKNLYVVGGNRYAAIVSGIDVKKVIISAFIIESILVGLGGVLEVARTGGANATYGFSYEFDAISACVVGGVSLNGGIGKVSGVIIGVVIFTLISYGLSYIGINPNWQLVIKGLIICSAVAVDMKKHAIS